MKVAVEADYEVDEFPNQGCLKVTIHWRSERSEYVAHLCTECCKFRHFFEGGCLYDDALKRGACSQEEVSAFPPLRLL